MRFSGIKVAGKRNLRGALVLLIVVVFLISGMAAFAGDKKGNSESTGGGKKTTGHEIRSGEVNVKDQNRDQKREKEMKQERERLCYQTRDGKEIMWQNRYNKRMRKYEAAGEVERMKRYLYRVAKRLGLKDAEEIESFIEWAMEVKPWDEEQVE